MNLVDQQTLEALQAALGQQSFGTPGFSPAFGQLPQQQQMAPGYSFMQGQSFFGPQLPNPHHLSLGQGPLGQMGGRMFEQLAARRGYQYMPTGVNVMDVMRGREFERGLEGAVGIGARMDEEQLSRAIEQGFKAALGYTSPATAAHANTLAQQFTPLMTGLGFFQQMPGGSAQDFARQMFVATQNMRDTTRDRYALGMEDKDAQGMIRRLLDFFAPQGQWDAQRARGMKFGDLGEMAGELTRKGLITTEMPQREVRAFAEKLGMDAEQLSDRSIESLRGAAQTLSVGRQLQSYADIVGTMREIMGKPDAPIPRIIDQLQQLTGGSMQQMDPNQIQQLLYRVKEMARTANISMDAMMEIVKTGATMYDQMGLSPLLGGRVATEAYAATVASQTMVTGAFRHRLSPTREADLRMQTLTRGTTSEGARVSVQAGLLLQDIDRTTLSPGQQAIYQRVQQRADAMGWNERNITELQDELSGLGIGHARSYTALMSMVGVQEELEQRPELLAAIQRGQMVETQSAIGTAVGDFYGYIERAGGSNDRMVKQIQATAAASGMSVPDVLDKVSQSYFHSPRGTTGERMRWLRDQGVDVSGLNGEALYRNLEMDRQIQGHLIGRGFKSTQELGQIYNDEKLQAQRAMLDTVAVGVAGQEMLADINVTARGGAFERVMGALAAGKTDVGDVMMTAFGFMPSEELLQQVDEKALKRISENHQLLQVARESGDTAGAARIQRQLEIDARAQAELWDRHAGVGGTESIQAILGTLDPQVLRAAPRIADRSLGDAERIGAIRTVVGAAGQWTADQVNLAAASMSPGDARGFKQSAAMYRSDARWMEGKLVELDEAKAAGDTARVQEIQEEMLAVEATTEGLADVGPLYRQLRRAERSEMPRGRTRTPAAAAETSNRIQAARARFVGAKTEKERRDALSEWQGLELGATDLLYGVDRASGKLVPPQDLIRQLVMLDERFLSDPEKREERVKELTEFWQGRLDDRALGTFHEESSMTDEQMKELQEDLRESGYDNVRFDTERLIGIKPLSTTDHALVTSGAYLDMDPRDIAREKKRVGSEQFRKTYKLSEQWEALQKIRSGLDTDTSTLGERGQKRVMADLGRTLRESPLFEDGEVTVDTARMVLATEGLDRGTSTLKTLGEMAAASSKGPDAIKQAVEIAKEREKADTEARTKGQSAGGGEAADGAITVTFKDAKTGEELGSGVTIEVNGPTVNRGREASQRVMPGGPGSTWIGNTQVA
jgi:hypothetical protein